MPVSPASDITTREDLIRVLMDAAELEHSVICQYLFAAFSLKKHPAEGGATWPQLECVRTWQADLLLVAREEMEHLGLVCNLLTAVGGTANFRRPAFPHHSPYAPAHRPFALERFDKAPMERFLHIEKMHGIISTSEAGETGEDDNPALSETIGGLYRRIRRGFEVVHETGDMLFVGPHEAQVDNAALDLPEGWFDFNLLNVVDLESALLAIDQIVEAGDGAPHHADVTHYRRFKNILTDFDALRDADSNFEPARLVTSNPLVQELTALESGHSVIITHPHTRRAMELFNSAYETMLLMLVRFYASTEETAAERAGLLRIAFFPMMTMVLRPLGEMLTLMPARDDLPGQTAGPSFECSGQLQLQLHPHRLSAWIILFERLQKSEAVCGELLREIGSLDAPWAVRIHPRLAFLHENLARMCHNFEHYVDLPSARMQHLFKKLF